MGINTNIKSRLLASRVLDKKEHADAEVKKQGNLRVGTSGIMSDSGDIAGACHRKALLRSKGIEIENIEDHKLIMFQLGYSNEDRTFDDLERTASDKEVILREEQIPVEWMTSNGTKVTGRPDIVLCEQEVHESGKMPAGNKLVEGDDRVSLKPVLALELKSVHSVWTARDVVFSGAPKLDNLIQAAHYMWKLGVPYKLVYKSYSALGQQISSWAHKFFPKQGEPLSELCDYTAKGDLNQIKQFEVVYDLRLDANGRVEYSVEGADKWTSTIVTVHDIERYFEYVSKMEETQQLGPRPLNVSSVGLDKSFNMCDTKYCPLAGICKSTEKLGYQAWLDAVVKHSEGVTGK